MKINVNYILSYLRKNKFILLLIFILIIIFFNFKTVREGLTGSSIGEYDYLAPLSQSVIDDLLSPSSQDIWDSFAKKYNSINNLKENGPGSLPVPMDKNTKGTLSALNRLDKPQLKYFIQNGEYPWDGYVTIYLKENPDAITSQNLKDTGGNPITLENAKKYYSNANVFGNFIYRRLANINPLPLAAQIYLGKTQPPANNTTNTDNNSSITTPSFLSSNTSSSSPSSSNSNYQDFVSLCKKVVESN